MHRALAYQICEFRVEVLGCVVAAVSFILLEQVGRRYGWRRHDTTRFIQKKTYTVMYLEFEYSNTKNAILVLGQSGV